MSEILIWIISLLAIAGIIFRPFKTAELIWAILGAVFLLLLGLISFSDAFNGILKGNDVYFFLIGMMLLAETARAEKLFDWLASHATKMAKGSSFRLFILIYLVGVVVTVFLSNDATAVVLTPAVAATMRIAKVEKPIPYLLICAFVANAASFVLPISNPANLVIYGTEMPSLIQWFPRYIFPSFISIVVTFFMLRLTQRKSLSQKINTDIPVPLLTTGGKTALIGIFFTVVVLLVSSTLDLSLGLPTAICGTLIMLLVHINTKKSLSGTLKGVSWSVLPLVASLFIIIEGLNKTGMVGYAASILTEQTSQSLFGASWSSGIFTALLSNLMNNLPVGLLAGHVIQTAGSPELVRSAILIGVDLGPNLSVTGSLATILWLVALRREGLNISGWAFFKIGSVVMVVALVCTLASLWVF